VGWSSGQRNVSGYKILFMQPRNIQLDSFPAFWFFNGAEVVLDVSEEMQSCTREFVHLLSLTFPRINLIDSLVVVELS
jgi:hypothetical protein